MEIVALVLNCITLFINAVTVFMLALAYREQKKPTDVNITNDKLFGHKLSLSKMILLDTVLTA